MTTSPVTYQFPSRSGRRRSADPPICPPCVEAVIDRKPGQAPLERRMRRDDSHSSLVAPSERGCLFQADAVRERISMPVHELPFGPVTAKDLCDTQ